MKTEDVLFLLFVGFAVGVFFSFVVWQVYGKDQYVARSRWRKDINDYNELVHKYNATLQRLRSLIHERDSWRNIAMSGGKQLLNAQFSTDEIKTLLQLCHPDKHGGRESATRITQKLLSMRNS